MQAFVVVGRLHIRCHSRFIVRSGIFLLLLCLNYIIANILLISCLFINNAPNTLQVNPIYGITDCISYLSSDEHTKTQDLSILYVFVCMFIRMCINAKNHEYTHPLMVADGLGHKGLFAQLYRYFITLVLNSYFSSEMVLLDTPL